MDYSTPSARDELVKALQGRTVFVPNLTQMLESWPSSVSEHLPRLRSAFDKQLEELFPPGQRLYKMKIADLALWACTWWPYSTFDGLCVVKDLAIWLFTWDDELDSAEYSDLLYDPGKAREFRRETIAYIQATLASNPLADFISSNPLITSFKPVGDALAKRYTPEQRTVFFHEIVHYIGMTQVEQEYQVKNELPTVEEYIQRRMGSSAIGPCLALTELCYGVQLPGWNMMDKHMRDVWDATHVIVWGMNDLLSLQKEVAVGQVDTIVPLLFLRHGSIEKAIEVAADMIQTAVKTLDQAELSLLSKYPKDKSEFGDITKFIDACKYACTSNLNWSLHSGRFRGLTPLPSGGFSMDL